MNHCRYRHCHVYSDVNPEIYNIDDVKRETRVYLSCLLANKTRESSLSTGKVSTPLSPSYHPDANCITPGRYIFIMFAGQLPKRIAKSIHSWLMIFCICPSEASITSVTYNKLVGIITSIRNVIYEKNDFGLALHTPFNKSLDGMIISSHESQFLLRPGIRSLCALCF